MSDDASPVADALGSPRALVVWGHFLSKFFSVRQGPFGRKGIVRAVDDVSVEIAGGETVGLVGESGSGKTTLGRLLLRLLEPTQGRIWFDGQEITHLHERDLRPLRRQMQMLFQDATATLDGRLTVAEIVAEPLRIHRLASTPADEQRLVQQLLDRVGLPWASSTRRPSQLSSGQCQRVSLARALSLEPRFIVCDEPMAALDAIEQQQIADLLQSLKRDTERCYLFISHDLRQVLHSSERVYVMYAGRIVETGDRDALRSEAQHPYTLALLNAVPEIDPRRRRLRLLLDGEPPSPFRPSEGCAFQPRCPRASPGLCEREVPPLVATGPDGRHEVACWHPHS